MFEQLSQLAHQFGIDSVINNSAVPNEQNEAVIEEASKSILNGLKNIAANGNTEQLAKLFEDNNASDTTNPVVNQLTQELSGNLEQKFGLSNNAASGVASSMIPQILSSIISKAKNPKDSSFNISDIIGAITEGGANANLMDIVTKYGGQFGLDQNSDGNVDMKDIKSAITSKNGTLGGIFGSVFGK